MHKYSNPKTLEAEIIKRITIKEGFKIPETKMEKLLNKVDKVVSADSTIGYSLILLGGLFLLGLIKGCIEIGVGLIGTERMWSMAVLIPISWFLIYQGRLMLKKE